MIWFNDWVKLELIEMFMVSIGIQYCAWELLGPRSRPVSRCLIKLNSIMPIAVT